MPEPTPAQLARARRRQLLVRITSWMIPPIFATAAVLLHVECAVPRSEMLPRPNEKDKAKKAKDKAKAKSKARREAGRARPQQELDRLRAQWGDKPLEDEPDNPDFRRQHDTLLRAVGQVARDAALDEKPSSLRVTPHCRTIRCSLELCGPKPAIDAIAEILPKLERLDGPLWHEFVELPPPEDTPPEPRAPREEAERKVCRIWQVGFRIDGTKRTDLRIDGEAPPVKLRPTTVPIDADGRPDSTAQPTPG